MSIPQESENLVNMMRLQGLNKKRKVIPGAEFLQNYDSTNADFAGISQEGNKPMAATGIGISPQSSDVRANQVINPEEEEENLFSKIARTMNPVQNVSPPPSAPPPIETQQVESAEGLPPINAEQEQEMGGFWNKIGNALGGFVKAGRTMAKEQPFEKAGANLANKVVQPLKEYAEPFFSSEKRDELYEKYRNPHAGEPNTAELLASKLGGANLTEERQQRAEAKLQAKQLDQEQLDLAQQNPLQMAVYGSTDAVASDPELLQDFQEITGVSWSPQLQEELEKYEAVITGMDEELAKIQGGYDEQITRIKERIDSGNSTDSDKFMVGLSLLMPLLIGGFFGKEAGLGALGGAAKGFSDIYARRDKQMAENEEALAGLNKEKSNLALKRGELDLKRASLRPEIEKNLPKSEKTHLQGMESAVWIDPETKRKKEIVRLKPGLVADAQYLNSKEALNDMRHQANDIQEAKTATQLIDTLTAEIIDIASKVSNKKWVSEGLASLISGKHPDLASRLNEQVEYEGRMVNAGIVLEHKLKLLTDAYRQAKGMKALTHTVQEHIDGLFRNPSQSFQTYKDTIDQMLYTRNLAHKNLINNARNHGFIPGFIEKEFADKDKEVFDRLNKKESQKRSSQLTRE